MIVLSIEGLPCGCRDGVLKWLQCNINNGAAAVLHDPSPSDTPTPGGGGGGGGGSDAFFDILLHRMRGLQRLAACRAVLCDGAWLGAEALQPPLGKLYRALGVALAKVLGVPLEAHHVMVYMSGEDPHEVFERIVDSGTQHRDMTLCGLTALKADLDAAAALDGPPRWASPFPCSVLTFPCPPYGSDSFATLARAGAVALGTIRTGEPYAPSTPQTPH